MIGLCADDAKLLMRRDNGLLTAYEAGIIAIAANETTGGKILGTLRAVLMWLRDKVQRTGTEVRLHGLVLRGSVPLRLRAPRYGTRSQATGHRRR